MPAHDLNCLIKSQKKYGAIFGQRLKARHGHAVTNGNTQLRLLAAWYVYCTRQLWLYMETRFNTLNQTVCRVTVHQSRTKKTLYTPFEVS